MVSSARIIFAIHNTMYNPKTASVLGKWYILGLCLVFTMKYTIDKS